MDIKLVQTGKIINLILVIGFSVAALFLGTAAFETISDGFFAFRRDRKQPSSQGRRSRRGIAVWDGRHPEVSDTSTQPCGRSLTVQDIASSFHNALYDASNKPLAYKAFKSMPLLLIYNGRRSEYITKMRVILINYFMSLFDRTIYNASLCVEACRAIQILCVVQSGPLAHNYNLMLGDAGAIDAVTDVLQIHMPTGSDCFLNVTLVTRNIRYLDENVKRHIFNFLYSSHENASVAELSCSVLGRLCNHCDATKDYTSVLNAIILALAAHVTNFEVAMQAFSTIYNCRLVKLAVWISDKATISLFNSIITALPLYKTDPRIVIMCCQIVNDLLDRKLMVNNLNICDSIVTCMRSNTASRSIRGGVFDILCDAAYNLSKNNKNILIKMESLNIPVLFDVGSENYNSLSPERIWELHEMKIKFSTFPFH